MQAGWTPLMYASGRVRKDDRILDVLMEFGADPCLRNGKVGAMTSARSQKEKKGNEKEKKRRREKRRKEKKKKEKKKEKKK